MKIPTRAVGKWWNHPSFNLSHAETKKQKKKIQDEFLEKYLSRASHYEKIVYATYVKDRCARTCRSPTC
jgi:hypothetical protein